MTRTADSKIGKNTPQLRKLGYRCCADRVARPPATLRSWTAVMAWRDLP